MWEIVTTAEYRAWARSLPDRDRARLQRAEHRIIDSGPRLGRPIADSVRGSKHSNMKELRPARTLRAFYALDPRQRIVLLCGGDKTTGQQGARWYRKAIRRADLLYSRHLANIEAEA
ncbi:type II toxin-antitoxin system RelE/ParE family toxin [Candidatus Poriferisodalis sp.]|uniref:type II toxin-antitoxin system RelE/ParE family toxin n=1 Tax=Candidatus Poriferisodalis sp. TaxID=3101277 RepID=UPI003AF569A9